jgi:hypothetical protein
MNGRPYTRFWSYIQSNYEGISCIQNETGNNLGAFRTSNLCQSMQKLSKFRLKWFGYCCALLLLDVSRLANGYTYNTAGVPFGWRRKRHCSCTKRTSRTIWQETIQQILHLRWVQDIQAREVQLRRQVSYVWCNCALCHGLLPKQLTKINAPGCFRETLCAKCTLQSCYGLIVCQMQSSTSTFSLWGRLRG